MSGHTPWNQIKHKSELFEAALAVYDAATRKGALFVTQENGSDDLVGFFVPAKAMNNLGNALVKCRTKRKYGLPVPVRTQSGRVLTDADIQALADEAERGYDVDHLLLAEAITVIEGLAQQQAIDDDWYCEPLERFRTHLKRE